MKHSECVIFLCIVLSANKIHSVVFKVFGNLQNRKEFACNTQSILQCIVNPNTNPVFWRVGKPVTLTTSIAAQCSGLTCSINPAVSGLYHFSYDENSGESNMTIKNVTLVEDGKQYECDDGSTPLILDSVIQVPPVRETTQISNMNMAEVAENMIITCSTGCVTKRTAQLVTFKWYTIDESGTESVYKDATPPSSSDDSPCQINSDCISDGSVALSNKFTITEDRTAPKVFFLVYILLDGDSLFSVKTTSMFQPKSGQDSTTNTNPFTHQTIAGTTGATVSFSTEVGSNATTKIVFIIIGVVVLDAVVVSFFYLFVFRRKEKKVEKETTVTARVQYLKKEQQNEK